jgi:uncharacterized membrane protein (UPF0127 family)
VTLPGGFTLLEASTLCSRTRGLAGQDGLPAGCALHLRPCRSVHTFGMRFALDLVWLGADGTPVRVDRSVAPRRHRSCRAARSVIEVEAGGADPLVRAWSAACGPRGILNDVDPDARPRLRLLKRERHS